MTGSGADDPGLQELQRQFAAYLRAPDPVAPQALADLLVPGASNAERLAVYWRSSRHAQRSALAAAYPVIAALVGEPLFAALCADHLQRPGSRSGDLHRLGQGFSATLRAEPACADHPYLGDVAELEWAVHRSFFQGDVLSGGCIDPRSIRPDQFERLRLVLAPGLVLLACATPAGRIWRAHQPGAAERLADIDWRCGPEWLAVQRVAAGVCVDPLDAAEYQFLLACQRGASLARALDTISPGEVALDRWLPRWLQLGLAEGLALEPG